MPAPEYVCVADTSVTHTEQELERCGECLPRFSVLEGNAATVAE